MLPMRGFTHNQLSLAKVYLIEFVCWTLKYLMAEL
jgi:hypothetical protein